MKSQAPWTWHVWALLAALAAVVAAGLSGLDRDVTLAVTNRIPAEYQKIAHFIGRIGNFTCIIPLVALLETSRFNLQPGRCRAAASGESSPAPPSIGQPDFRWKCERGCGLCRFAWRVPVSRNPQAVG